MVTFPCCFKTEIGSKKSVCNEDGADFFVEKGFFFLCVGDGQGSKTPNERAVSLAIEEFKQLMKRSHFSDVGTLANEINRAFYTINRLFKLIRSLEGEKLSGLTCGLSVVAVNEQRELLICHMGNSRIHLTRSGETKLLTNDHTVAFDEYLQSKITFEDVAYHSERGILTRYFGQPSDDLLCDMNKGVLKKDDMITITTDGVHGYCKNEEILYILSQVEGNIEEACENVVKLADERQAFDDKTVAILVV